MIAASFFFFFFFFFAEARSECKARCREGGSKKKAKVFVLPFPLIKAKRKCLCLKVRVFSFLLLTLFIIKYLHVSLNIEMQFCVDVLTLACYVTLTLPGGELHVSEGGKGRKKLASMSLLLSSTNIKSLDTRVFAVDLPLTLRWEFLLFHILANWSSVMLS